MDVKKAYQYNVAGYLVKSDLENGFVDQMKLVKDYMDQVVLAV